jgi:hypothetical protein
MTKEVMKYRTVLEEHIVQRRICLQNYMGTLPVNDREEIAEISGQLRELEILQHKILFVNDRSKMFGVA